MPVPK